MKSLCGILLVLMGMICLEAKAQVTALERPENSGCRKAHSDEKASCVEGDAAIAQFRQDDDSVMERILRITHASTEKEVHVLLGQPRVIKPVVRMMYKDTPYEARSISWWASTNAQLSDDERAPLGTIEVQFINGSVTTVWWHRSSGSFFHRALASTPRIALR